MKALMDTTISQLLDTYFTSLTVRGLKSPKTIQAYKGYLYRLSKYLGDGFLVSSLDLPTIERWHETLLDAGISQTTVGYYLIAIRSLLHWMTQRGYAAPLLPDQIELPRTERTIKNIPTVEQVRMLLNSVKTNDIRGLRDRAVLEMLFTSGMRVGEICSLTRDQMDFDGCKATIIGKGNHERLIHFSPKASEFIKEYLSRRRDNLPYLFARHDANKGTARAIGSLVPRSIQRTIQFYGEGVGLHITPHYCRHFFATYLLQKKTDIYTVSQFLGHRSIQTTLIYLHTNNPAMEDLHRKAFSHSGI